MKLQKSLFEILLLSMLWGPSFLFIKIAVGDIAPLTMTALRTLIGVLLLYIVLKFRKIRLWKHRKLGIRCFIIGIFANGLPWICFNFAVKTIPTSLASLINGTTPVLTIILANIFLKDEKLTWGRGIGATVGLVGFCVLFLPTVFSSLQGTDFALDMQGIVLSFIGASSYAIGIVYVRKNLPSVPPLVAPVMQLSSSLLYLIPLAFIFESPLRLIQTASLQSWLGILGLAVFGTAFAFIMYYRIIERQGATAVSTVTYLLPVFGTILGVVFLNETLDVQFFIAAILIFSGVLIVNRVIPLSFLKRNKIAPLAQ
ncbi:MAG TPA: DMT family transporter [Gammaproteobacteria bacterium]|nr:DMT family transporter [Gammaproteobacteria bacterium]